MRDRRTAIWTLVAPCWESSAANSRRCRRACSEVPHRHPRPQHGGRPRPDAGLRRSRRGLRQADHRGRQQLHRVRARPRPPRSRSAGSSPRRSTRPAASRASSTRSPSTTASRWATAACSTPCRRRDLIADCVEYMVEAHCADALICISNCDKITPGMLMRRAAAQHPDGLRLRRPDGGRQGHPGRRHGPQARPDRRDVRRRQRERLRRGHPADRGERLPDLRLVLGHVHRQLDELPDRGDRPRRCPATARSSPPTPPARRCTRTPAATVVEITKRYYDQDDETVLPRNIATREAFENAMALDIAMGGSTNTILHLLAAAQEAERRLRPGRHQRGLAPGALPGEGRPERRTGRHVLHGGRAPGRRHPRHPRRAAPRRACSNEDVHTVHSRPVERLARRPGTSAAARRPPRPWSCGTRRPAACAPPRPSRSPSAGRPSTRTRPAAASATSSTRTPRTAASRSCRATSPSTAAS